MAMLNTVSVPSICVPGSFCVDFCSVDVTSNLSHQLLCFIMLSYCSYFIIVYNYISLISCLFILTLFYYRKKKRRRRRKFLFSSTSISQKTHIHYTISNNSKQHKYKLYNTTMNRHNVLFVNKHCCNNLFDSMALLQRYFNTCLYNTMSAILKNFCLTKL